MEPFVPAAVEVLTEAGYEVTVERHDPGFAQLLVVDPGTGERIGVDLGVDYSMLSYLPCGLGGVPAGIRIEKVSQAPSRLGRPRDASTSLGVNDRKGDNDEPEERQDDRYNKNRLLDEGERLRGPATRARSAVSTTS